MLKALQINLNYLQPELYMPGSSAESETECENVLREG